MTTTLCRTPVRASMSARLDGVSVCVSRPALMARPAAEPCEVKCRSRVHEPDRQISRIRLSDKTSRLHPRHVVPKPAQAYEPKVPVKMREWIGPALRRLVLCLNCNHRRNRIAV